MGCGTVRRLPRQLPDGSGARGWDSAQATLRRTCFQYRIGTLLPSSSVCSRRYPHGVTFFPRIGLEMAERKRRLVATLRWPPVPQFERWDSAAKGPQWEVERPNLLELPPSNTVLFHILVPTVLAK